MNLKKLIAAKNSKRRQKNGYVLVGFLTLLPCLVVLFVAVLIFLGFLTHDQHLKKICRDHLLKSQQNESELLTQILALNPQAALLQMQKTQALIGLMHATATGQAQLAAVYAAQVKRIHDQQKILEKIQQGLFSKSRWKKNFLFFRIRTEMVKTNLNFHSGFFYSSRLVIAPHKAHELALTPKTKGPAPIYELKKNFEKEQTLSVFWNLFFSQGQLIEKQLPFQFRWQRSCEVTLKKKGKTWEKNLLTDKFFWK